jgi:hypothetical protein
MRKEIEEYIINNKIVNDYFDKIDKEYKDDFRQYIYLIIFELINCNASKIETLYLKDELGKFIIGIINNQLKSNTSSFHKVYRKTIDIDNYSYDKVNNELEDLSFEFSKKINYKNLINKIDNLHPYHATLFKMKWIDGLTINQISKKTKIKYTTIYASIKKTEGILKKIKWIND